jgi:hypothetical protein
MDPVTLGMAKLSAEKRESTEIGRVSYNPVSTVTKSGISASTTGVMLQDGRKDLALDFIAPRSGMVEITWDTFVTTPATVGNNTYTGMCIFLGDVVVSGSGKLLTRNDPATTTHTEGRFVYRHVLTGLTPGASYTVHPGVFSAPSALTVRINVGGSYGAFTGVARSVSNAGASPLGKTYSMADPSTVLTDGKINSFPGATKASNGAIVVGYCSSTALVSGGNGLWALRSTDNGATWSAPISIENDVTLQYGTAAMSTLVDGTIVCVSWARPTAGGQPSTGAIWFTSSDHGVTWSARKTITLPSSWSTLGSNWVSESPMIEFGGARYLAAWGYSGGRVYPEAEAGILRSIDNGMTWSRVAFLPNQGTIKQPNEIGFAIINNKLYAIIRDEFIHGFHYIYSANGTQWSTPTVGRAQATGGPRPLVKDNIAYWVARYGPDSTGQGHIVGIAENGKMWRVAHIQSSTTTLYGQGVDLGGNQIGFLTSAGVNASVADLKWSVLTVS